MFAKGNIPGEVQCAPPVSIDSDRSLWLRPYVRQSSLDLRPAWHMRSRKLLDYLLVYIISGKGRFVIGDKEYVVTPNSLVWIPPDTEHEMSGEDPEMELGYIHFDLIYSPERSCWNAMIPGGVLNLDSCRQFMHPPVPDQDIRNWTGILFSGNTPPPLAQLIRRIILEHRQQRRHTLQLGGMMIELIAHIEEARHLENGGNAGNFETFRRAVTAIAGSRQAEIDFRKLAAELNVSPSHLRNLFHAYRNCSPRTFFQMVRISRGCELLSYTDRNVSEIAEMLGFGSIYSFSRAFKRVMGMSPVQFRSCGNRNPVFAPACEANTGKTHRD